MIESDNLLLLLTIVVSMHTTDDYIIRIMLLIWYITSIIKHQYVKDLYFFFLFHFFHPLYSFSQSFVRKSSSSFSTHPDPTSCFSLIRTPCSSLWNGIRGSASSVEFNRAIFSSLALWETAAKSCSGTGAKKRVKLSLGHDSCFPWEARTVRGANGERANRPANCTSWKFLLNVTNQTRGLAKQTRPSA